MIHESILDEYYFWTINFSVNVSVINTSFGVIEIIQEMLIDI